MIVSKSKTQMQIIVVADLKKPMIIRDYRLSKREGD